MSLLKELPANPQNKKGWPWSEESPVMPALMPNGKPWPKISIVTPSFNQGQFIEETIRSVLLQNYPNLEYLIIDGGSSDDSVEIIKKYEPWLTYWVSEKDEGQSHAINKGMQLATGEIAGWLNSDDIFLVDGLANLIECITQNNDAIAWVGACAYTDMKRNTLFIRQPIVGDKADFLDWDNPVCIGQPACFFNRSVFLKIGGLNQSLHYVLDVELWSRLAEFGGFSTTDKIIGIARMYEGIKTYQDPRIREIEHIVSCWNLGEKDVAKIRLERWENAMAKKIILDMSPYFLTNILTIWLYRKLIKHPFSLLKKLYHEKSCNHNTHKE